MQRASYHCDPNRLRLLLDEKLPAKQQSDTVQHLDECAQCQQALETLAADRDWWSELRQMNGKAEPTTSIPSQKALPAHSERESAGDLAVDFLDPSEEATHIGKLGSFLITEIVGRGGMGIVFKAHDAALNRPVAIKVLLPHFANSGAARKRFDRESKAAAAVVHEHVVPIHGVDTWKGLPYLVMSFIAGCSVQERIDRLGPCETKEILRIGMQAASGLAAAHAQGLVHRDVKPANILLENGVERVRLTDFGLARAVDDASLTQSGVVAGTPQYMSPEQAKGDAIDHRADLFSLGSTLYAMAAGHAPFRADSAMAVLRRICEEQPRPLREINPDIPIWLAAIIEKLHAKSPDHRFQSAAEVADLLGGCLAHLHQPDTVLLPANLPPQQRKGKSHRRRWLAAASFLALIATTAFLWPTLSAWFAPQLENNTESRGEPDLWNDRLDDARTRTSALETELLHRSGPGFPDRTDSLIHDIRQKLQKLEKDLSETARK